MPSRVPLSQSDITVGQPLPWSVYDGSGRMLFKRGAVIPSDAVVARLMKREPMREEAEPEVAAGPRGGGIRQRDQQVAPERFDPFHTFERLHAPAQQTLNQLADSNGDALERLHSILERIRELAQRSPDACIAIMHLQSEQQDPASHAIESAMLTELLAEADTSREHPESLLAAAFTENIGMLHYQEKLNQQASGLSQSQWQELQQHPRQSVELLAAAGVSDKAWLRAVAQHHERCSGEGYPAGLNAEQIAPGAHLLGIVDSYLGMIGRRGYRDAKTPQEALRHFLENGSDYVRSLSERLIRALGVFPPGSFVRLENGEYAVVVARNAEQPLRPRVRAVASMDGKPYTVANERNPEVESQRIRGFASDAPALAIQPASLWVR